MQEQSLEIYRDGELIQPPVAVRLGQSVLEAIKTVSTASLKATVDVLGDAATDISLYHEDRELWREWKQTRHQARVNHLRSQYELV